MDRDFSVPPISLITSDGEILYYFLDKLLNSCRYFDHLFKEFGEIFLKEIHINLSSYSLNLFLNFLEKEDIPDELDKIVDIFHVAAVLDLHSLNNTLTTKQEIIGFFNIAILSKYFQDIPYSSILEFFNTKGFLLWDWDSYHYLLTHREEMIEYYKNIKI